ncbi:hypothetical protein ColLi_09787 [Colletotrichum liriopes]|uniref:Uncharacterized protein n=1 Tax=Colletotrichum liriopes TaxID=708192 RepID=A0AA37LW31_9PEZI|nr:hypothetical protein ColLi_09787 [Colletotrichum liriopes]
MCLSRGAACTRARACGGTDLDAFSELWQSITVGCLDGYRENEESNEDQEQRRLWSSPRS